MKAFLRKLPAAVWLGVAVTLAWEALFVFGFQTECWDCAPDGHRVTYATGPAWFALIGPLLGVAVALVMIQVQRLFRPKRESRAPR